MTRRERFHEWVTEPYTRRLEILAFALAAGFATWGVLTAVFAWGSWWMLSAAIPLIGALDIGWIGVGAWRFTTASRKSRDRIMRQTEDYLRRLGMLN